MRVTRSGGSGSDDGPHDGAASPVEELARELAALRRAAGNPSFRALAQRSGCISHTTLHEAVRGTRFPSWETTKQFVLACGDDPDSWQARWDAASARHEEVQGAGAGITASAPGPVEPAASAPTGGYSSAASAGGPPPAPHRPGDAEVEGAGPKSGPVLAAPRRGRALWAAVAVAALLVGGGIGALIGHRAGAVAAPPSAAASEQKASGDDIGGIEDDTLPDYSEVPAGTTVRKTWTLPNTGTVTWSGRRLVRITPDDATGADCATPAAVEVPETPPGGSATVSVDITAQPEPGLVCRVEWRMFDEDDTVSFPDGRPLFFLLRTT